MKLPWAEDMSRFTRQFERIAIQFLEASENRSKTEHIKATARGFRNFKNYRISILFYCGKLDIDPQ